MVLTFELRRERQGVHHVQNQLAKCFWKEKGPVQGTDQELPSTECRGDESSEREGERTHGRISFLWNLGRGCSLCILGFKCISR